MVFASKTLKKNFDKGAIQTGLGADRLFEGGKRFMPR